MKTMDKRNSDVNELRKKVQTFELENKALKNRINSTKINKLKAEQPAPP